MKLIRPPDVVPCPLEIVPSRMSRTIVGAEIGSPDPS
jgi:hypothetical protein